MMALEVDDMQKTAEYLTTKGVRSAATSDAMPPFSCNQN